MGTPLPAARLVQGGRGLPSPSCGACRWHLPGHRPRRVPTAHAPAPAIQAAFPGTLRPLLSRPRGLCTCSSVCPERPPRSLAVALDPPLPPRHCSPGVLSAPGSDRLPRSICLSSRVPVPADDHTFICGMALLATTSSSMLIDSLLQQTLIRPTRGLLSGVVTGGCPASAGHVLGCGLCEGRNCICFFAHTERAHSRD